MSSFINLSINPTYNYDSYVIPTITTCHLYSEIIKSLEDKHPIDASPYEMILKNFDDNNYIIPSIMLRLEISLIYTNNNQIKCGDFHLINAYNLALKYDVLNFFVRSALPMIKQVEKRLKANNITIDPRVKKYAKNINKQFIDLMIYLNKPRTIFNLSGDDFTYLIYATNNLTNKEIAYKLNVSEDNVAQRYSKLYKLLDANNKKELIESFKDKLNKY